MSSSSSSTLGQWLRARGFWVFRDTAVAAGAPLPHFTHVFMDGGRACVPDAERGEFGRVYAQTIAAGKSDLHVVERLPPQPSLFRMFLDVDLPGGVCLVREVMSALPPELRTGSVIVCTKRQTTCSKPLVKSGAHLVWEDVWVDADQAMSLRDAIVADKSSPDGGRLDAALDASVYRKGGLRMPWSFKGRHRGGSNADPPSWYEPTQVADAATGTLYPVAVDPRDSEAVEVWLRRMTLVASDPEAGPRCPFARTPLPPSPTTDTSTALASSSAVPEAIVAMLPSVYATCRFEKVTWNADRTALSIRTDSRSCFIGTSPSDVPREHRNNRVTLFVTATDVFQYCFCRCVGSPCAEPGARAHLVRHGVEWLEGKGGAAAGWKSRRPSVVPPRYDLASPEAAMAMMARCEVVRRQRR